VNNVTKKQEAREYIYKMYAWTAKTTLEDRGDPTPNIEGR
jgi:hypothetical protein